jgi:starch synthase
LDVPNWVGPASARTGRLADGTTVTLISVPGIARAHPYDDPAGEAWTDNDQRFFAFAASAAAHVTRHPPEVLHLHDWHAGAVLGFLPDAPPSVLTIHNLAYQGRASGEWLERLTHRPEAYEWFGDANPLSGAIALADRVITVSPTFAAEIVQDGGGFGLEEPLRHRWKALSGIINGLDTEVWDPAADPLLPSRYRKPAGKKTLRTGLLRELGWSESLPLISMVTRLTDQKGVDLALGLVASLPDMGSRLVLLGSGDRALSESATALSARHPDYFCFLQGYDEPRAHLLFAGSDLFLMPSRFEPCGLAQMQAMAYGTIPVATAVGGLVDTIIDDDAFPGSGTGFLAASPTVADVLDAAQRAIKAWHSPRRRKRIQRQGMAVDWSWEAPAAAYVEAYRSAIGEWEGNRPPSG